MAANDEMTEGYLDGRSSDLKELPEGNNRSDSYKHGWKNGRDDRLSRPRSVATELRKEAADIARREAGYI